MLWFVKCLWFFFFAGEAKFFIVWILSLALLGRLAVRRRRADWGKRREHFGGVSKASSSPSSFSLAVAVVARRGSGGGDCLLCGEWNSTEFFSIKETHNKKKPRTNVVITWLLSELNFCRVLVNSWGAPTHPFLSRVLPSLSLSSQRRSLFQAASEKRQLTHEKENVVSPPERRSAPPSAVGEGKRRSDARGLVWGKGAVKRRRREIFPCFLVFHAFSYIVVAQKCNTVRNHVSPLCSGQKNILCNEQVYVGQTPVQLLLHFGENLLLPFCEKKKWQKLFMSP